MNLQLIGSIRDPALPRHDFPCRRRQGTKSSRHSRMLRHGPFRKRLSCRSERWTPLSRRVPEDRARPASADHHQVIGHHDPVPAVRRSACSVPLLRRVARGGGSRQPTRVAFGRGVDVSPGPEVPPATQQERVQTFESVGGTAGGGVCQRRDDHPVRSSSSTGQTIVGSTRAKR